MKQKSRLLQGIGIRRLISTSYGKKLSFYPILRNCCIKGCFCFITNNFYLRINLLRAYFSYEFKLFLTIINPNTMKKSIFYFVLGVLTVSTIAFVSKEKAPVKENNFASSFSQLLTHAKAYTLEVAEAMPEEHYTFKSSDSVRSFGEQMAHIGMSNSFILNAFIKGEKMDFNPAAAKKMEKELGASKAEVIKLLNSSFDDVIATLNGMDAEGLESTFVFFFDPSNPEFTKEQGFGFIRDHITHHRAQAIVSLRMKVPNKKAPGYRAF